MDKSPDRLPGIGGYPRTYTAKLRSYLLTRRTTLGLLEPILALRRSKPGRLTSRRSLVRAQYRPSAPIRLRSVSPTGGTPASKTKTLKLIKAPSER
jgi:hypothetical protein